METLPDPHLAVEFVLLETLGEELEVEVAGAAGLGRVDGEPLQGHIRTLITRVNATRSAQSIHNIVLVSCALDKYI